MSRKQQSLFYVNDVPKLQKLTKFEQQRKEVYRYDIAVANDSQRKGIGLALIEALQSKSRPTVYS